MALGCCDAPTPPSGIGLETSLQFAAEGALVVLSDVNEEAVKKAAARASPSSSPRRRLSRSRPTSARRRTSRRSSRLLLKFGRLDVLFNNAGIMHPK
jgi:NAD(P)-dependent dehydrogenase (short-subunit alcohol dehydrogenase family)